MRRGAGEWLAALALALLVPSPPLAAGPPEAEAAALEAARAAVETVRKSQAVLAVVDAAGSPVPGARVRVRQLASDFRFGANLYLFGREGSPELERAYRERFAALFNYATTDVYWKYYEPERGKPRYDYTERVAAWCAGRGIRLKGHPLLWQHTAGTVDWARGEPAERLERERVLALVGRFRGRVHGWDVVNEPAHAPREVELPFRWARSADPDAELIINDYQVLHDGFARYLDLVGELLARGTPIDAVGIQGHWPLHTRFPLERVVEHLDRYARLGKPLHLTELVVTSGGQAILGSHVKGVWDEAAQADYVEKLYRVLFAHPAVAAITWWDLSDRDAWQPGGGLLRADMSPKPAYLALLRLVTEQWRTALELETGREGWARWRGFHGRYEAECGGARIEFELRKGGLNAFRIQLAPAPAKSD